jgi:hypothetical protein
LIVVDCSIGANGVRFKQSRDLFSDRTISSATECIEDIVFVAATESIESTVSSISHVYTSIESIRAKNFSLGLEDFSLPDTFARDILGFFVISVASIDRSSSLWKCISLSGDLIHATSFKMVVDLPIVAEENEDDEDVEEGSAGKVVGSVKSCAGIDRFWLLLSF